MLKALPCPFCRKPATLPGGKTYALANPPDAHHGMTYRCARCRNVNEITAVEFHRLRPMSFEELDKGGLVDEIVNDFPGMTREQLQQVHAAGVPLAVLHPREGERGTKVME